MLHPAGLGEFQRRQIRQSGGFHFIQCFFTKFFESVPAFIIEFRRMRDLSHTASPLDDDTVNITHAQSGSGELGFDFRVFMDGSNHFAGTETVFWRNPVFQITGSGLAVVCILADISQTNTPAGFIPGKTVTCVQVG